jgi:hypothetical protein
MSIAWTRSRLLALVFLVAAQLGPAPAAAGGVVKLAVVLGNNRGARSAEVLRYAHSDARKVKQVLQQLGGVTPSNMRLLLGASSDRAWGALREIERRAASYRRKGLRTLLLVYYSGHADGGALELGASRLRFAEVTRFLKSSRADVRIAVIDSCRSGRLLAAKGGRHGSSYHIHVTDQMAARGYAVITSSAANELSQESEEIRGSLFTHYWISALRGVADRSGDGRVTLSEAYRYAYGRTVARTMAHVGGGQHPMYDLKLAGHGEVVLTRPGATGSRLTVESDRPGRLVVVRGEGDAVVAEGDVAARRPVKLAVAPGAYTVYLVSGRDAGVVRRARVEVTRKGGRVTPGGFNTYRLRRGLNKGGLLRPRPTHRLDAGLVLRRMPLSESALSYGSVLAYHLELPSGLQPSVRLGWCTAGDDGYSTGFQALSAHLGLGYRFGLPATLVLSAELAAGYGHLFQDGREGAARHTSELSHLGLLGLGLPVGPIWAQADVGAGGRLFRLNEALTHRLDLLLQVTVGWRWEP